jgi:predicted phosphodiesterase
VARILACSDIHNNVTAVRKLRSREAAGFDAVIVAGDIGSNTAQEIFDILSTFDCPILFVLGNWDHGLSHHTNFGERCHHLHLSPFRLDGLSIVGESIDGIDQTWEAIRTDLEAKNPADLRAAGIAYTEHQRRLFAKIVADEGPDRTIVVTHYRLTKTKQYLPDVPLFLFGHNHGFADSTFQGSRFVNVSALDTKVTVVPSTLNRHSITDYRFINDGSYVVITHDPIQGFVVESRRFEPDFTGWRRIEKQFYSGALEVE